MPQYAEQFPRSRTPMDEDAEVSRLKSDYRKARARELIRET